MKRAALEASIYACDNIEPIVVDGKLDFDGSTFAKILTSFASGVTTIDIPEPENGKLSYYYFVTPKLAENLYMISMDDPEFFDVCAQMCAVNILAGFTVPKGMEPLAACVLTGKFKRPTLANRPRSANFTEQLYLFNLITDIAKKFDLLETRADEGNNKDSACDIVSRAMKVCGISNKSYNTLKNLMIHPDHLRLRREIETINRIYERNEATDRSISTNFLNPKFIPLREKLDDLVVKDILLTIGTKPRKKQMT